MSFNVKVIKKNGEIIFIPKISGFKLHKGDKITFMTGGGGGYGDPQLRDSKLIKNDLKQGYLSEEYIKQNFINYKFY